MDTGKTKKYYEALPPEDVCQCECCQNYVRQVRSAYPLVADYLQGLGVDIEKPLETWPLESEENGEIDYLDVQYVVLGSRVGFRKTKISDVCIEIAESHPPTNIRDAHFVIQADRVRLKWQIPSDPGLQE